MFVHVSCILYVVCAEICRTASSVRHLRMEVPSDCWGSSLSALLQGIVLCFCAANKQAIVFVATKTQADALAHESAAVNFSAAVLHGGVEQQTREAIMHAFKKGERFLLSLSTKRWHTNPFEE